MQDLGSPRPEDDLPDEYQPRARYPQRAPVRVDQHLWRHSIESSALAGTALLIAGWWLPHTVPLWAVVTIGGFLTAVAWYSAILATGSGAVSAYLGAWGLAATGWLGATRLTGAWNTPAIVALLAIVVTLAPLGAVAIGHHRDRVRRLTESRSTDQKNTRELRYWERLLDELGVPGVIILDVVQHQGGKDVYGRMGKSTADRRVLTVDAVKAVTVQIAVHKRLAVDDVHVEQPPDSSSADFILHVRNRRSGPRETVYLPAENNPQTVTRPLGLGVHDSGREYRLLAREVAIIIIGVRNAGKALSLDTPLATPSGWTTMGEIQPGDQVFDETGQPCTVLAATEVMYGRPCYEISFSDGARVIADAQHQWLVDTDGSRRSQRRRPKPRKRPDWIVNHDQGHLRKRPEILTTEQMIPGLRVLRRSGSTPDGGQNNYSVRVASPLRCPEAGLPVPPYTLGAWLGNGTTVTGSITTADREIISEIEAEGETAWAVPSTIKAHHASYRISGLGTRLRAAGVLGNKHIPDIYLRASEDQRRALLAGLLDTDGYCALSGSAEFCSTRERLARDTYRLISSLGYKASIRSKQAMLNGKDCGTAWIVSFTPAEKVFRLPRKAARQVTKVRSTAPHRYITGIRPVPSVPVRCIGVDSPSHLYLAGDSLIPTHNSNTLNVFIAQLARCVDALIFMIDLKGGRAARPWMIPWIKGFTRRPVIDWLATTREEALLMLNAILAGGQARARSGEGGEKITPTADVPAIFLLCDETAVMTGHGIREGGISNYVLAQKLAQITETFRSEAIDPIVAALRGNVDTMGSTAVKAMSEVRIGLRVTQASDGQSIFPDDAKAAAALARLRDPGDGLVKCGPDISAPVHFYRVTAEIIEKVALFGGDIRPGPEDRFVAAMGDAYEQRWTRPHGQQLLREWREQEGVPEPADLGGDFGEIIAHMEDPEAEVDPRRKRMREILIRRGLQGFTVAQLTRRLADDGLTTPRETVHRWLAADEGAGYVRRSGGPHHRWSWVQAGHDDDYGGHD